MESMVRGNRMCECEGGQVLWGWEKAEPSRPDGRLLTLRLDKDLSLCKHEEFNSYYMEDNWMQIWGLPFQSWHVKPQDGGMPSSHDSGKEWERKEILLCRNHKSLGENIFQVSEKTNIWSFQWVRKKSEINSCFLSKEVICFTWEVLNMVLVLHIFLKIHCF